MSVSNCIIEQSPLGTPVIPVGQKLIFTISNNDAIQNKKRVKFTAQVHIATKQINLSVVDDIIGTFKTTPNNFGVGIFDLSNVVENFVNADHLAGANSTFKNFTSNSNVSTHPLHLIDKFSSNSNLIRYMAIQFAVEYLDDNTSSGTFNQIIRDGAVNTGSIKLINSYIKRTDILQSSISGNKSSFGFQMGDFALLDNTRRYLTNSPVEQYANSGDYGTLAFLVASSFAFTNAFKIRINYFDSSGSEISIKDEIEATVANGAFASYDTFSKQQTYYFGCFPGNLKNWSTNFTNAVNSGLSYYTIKLLASNNAQRLETRTIYINCPNTQGYESIRLCWLNQWGAWDYYTFTQKSVRTIMSEGTTYKQLEGGWNSSDIFTLDGFQGGKKTFRRNAKEKITINTNFEIEHYNVMFEELMNSPEVYLLQGHQTDQSTSYSISILNQYVTPVRILNSSFVKKTKANDQLIQYTFEIEKSKTLRTQSI